jgi:hypothetical protein
MYVYIYIYIYTYIQYIYTCTHTYMHTPSYIYTNIYRHINTHKHTHNRQVFLTADEEALSDYGRSSPGYGRTSPNFGNISPGNGRESPNYDRNNRNSPTFSNKSRPKHCVGGDDDVDSEYRAEQRNATARDRATATATATDQAKIRGEYDRGNFGAGEHDRGNLGADFEINGAYEKSRRGGELDKKLRTDHDRPAPDFGGNTATAGRRRATAEFDHGAAEVLDRGYAEYERGEHWGRVTQTRARSPGAGLYDETDTGDGGRRTSREYEQRVLRESDGAESERARGGSYVVKQWSPGSSDERKVCVCLYVLIRVCFDVCVYICR